VSEYFSDIIEWALQCDDPLELMTLQSTIVAKLRGGFFVGEVAFLPLSQEQIALISHSLDRLEKISHG
jgi:hypothetical protein